MNTLRYLIPVLLLTCVLFTACIDSNSLEVVPAEYAELPGMLIDQDTVWAGELTIKGQYYVLPGVTLTIRPGTTVNWVYHSNNIEDVGALITLPADNVSFEDGPRPSGRLFAEGTAENPIVFTSAHEPKRAGDWGGIVLAGDAPNNLQTGSGRVEGLPQTIRYGGDNSGDDSGSLSYVRIEYGGFGFAPGSEINGLSLYSVGNGTDIHHIQVYKSKDDGFEWFGGTVNTRYLVSMYNEDDSFDFDQGWTGQNQFWFGLQGETADKGIEADGSMPDVTAEDLRPVIYNLTLIGRDGEGTDINNNGMHFRNGFKGEIKNSIISRFDGSPWLLDAGTVTTYDQQLLSLGNIMLHDNGDWSGNDASVFEADYVQENPDFLNPGSPEFNYIPASEASKAGSSFPATGFFDANAIYLGAFNPGSQIPWIAEGNWVRTSDD